MRWRLYYGDDTVYEGEGDEDAFAVPSMSIQITKQEADNGRGYTTRSGCKFFVWERITRSGGVQLEEGRWAGKDDDFGLAHYYFTHQGPQKVLVGIEIDNALYAHIKEKAATDGCLCRVPCHHTIPRIKEA